MTKTIYRLEDREINVGDTIWLFRDFEGVKRGRVTEIRYNERSWLPEAWGNVFYYDDEDKEQQEGVFCSPLDGRHCVMTWTQAEAKKKEQWWDVFYHIEKMQARIKQLTQRADIGILNDIEDALMQLLEHIDKERKDQP